MDCLYLNIKKIFIVCVVFNDVFWFFSPVGLYVIRVFCYITANFEH